MEREIKVIALVSVGQDLKETKKLPEDQRQAVARWLKKTYLEELFRGKAVFQWKNG
jgi:hypothetical protein